MVEAVVNAVTTSYRYDGEGRRLKKTVGTAVTRFVYGMGGELVAEHEGVTASPSTPTKEYVYGPTGMLAEVTGSAVNFLTPDHLGSPRVLTSQNGIVVNRRDFFPFGEDIAVGVGGRTAGMGYGTDSLRQRFTGYERDEETGLDFAQARYYANTLGRFQSADPLYFQGMMVIDPQQFNGYVYTRNNPLKWIDPTGERLFLGGNINWLVSNVLYELAGGQGQFQTYFQVQDGQVILREGADLSQANSGVQLLVELVQSNENYLFFADSNGAAAADLFQGSRDNKGRLTQMGKSLAIRFNGSTSQTGGVGYLLGTRGRPNQLQPANLSNGDSVFSVIAYNTNLVQTQVGINVSSIFPGAASSPEVNGQIEGMGHIIRPVSFFIHEASENRKFEEIGPKYETAHHHAIRREGIIRQELRIGGGFAGAIIQSVVKKP